MTLGPNHSVRMCVTTRSKRINVVVVVAVIIIILLLLFDKRLLFVIIIIIITSIIRGKRVAESMIH